MPKQDVSIARYFADLPDPRIDRTKKHSLGDILVIALCAVICGADSWEEVEAFGEAKHDWLKSFLTLPNGIRPAALTAAAWSRVLRSPVLMGIVSVTALQGAGQFVLFSYFGPILKQSFGADATTLSVMWALFGACGLVGNMVVSRFIDRVGAGRMVLVTTLLIAASLLLWPLASTLAWLAVVLVPWGLGCFATNSAQQARLVGLAPALAPGSVALNSSGIYTGQAVGAALGGWLLANDVGAWMSWVGLALVLIAILLSVAIDRSRRAP